jgi:hypothetical protein
MEKTFFFFWLIIILLSACEKKSPNLLEQTPELLFKSGFEGNVYIDNTAYEDNEDYRFIRGMDSETGFSWPINILGASGSALHYIDDDNHQAVFAELQTVIGHNGNQTTVLYQQENYNTDVTQCPYEILDIKDGTKDLYIKFWIKLDSASLYKPNMWRTYFEWKSKKYAKGSGFRLISFIYTDDDEIPYWSFQGDKNPEHPIWEINNKNIPVPVNEWFMNEFYWHWSEGDDGVVLWKVNGQEVGKHYGPTTINGNPIDFIMIGQIYGNSNPKYQWIDDIEIWNTLIE